MAHIGILSLATVLVCCQIFVANSFSDCLQSRNLMLVFDYSARRKNYERLDETIDALKEYVKRSRFAWSNILECQENGDAMVKKYDSSNQDERNLLKYIDDFTRLDFSGMSKRNHLIVKDTSDLERCVLDYNRTIPELFFDCPRCYMQIEASYIVLFITDCRFSYQKQHGTKRMRELRKCICLVAYLCLRSSIPETDADVTVANEWTGNDNRNLIRLYDCPNLRERVQYLMDVLHDEPWFGNRDMQSECPMYPRVPIVNTYSTRPTNQWRAYPKRPTERNESNRCERERSSDEDENGATSPGKFEDESQGSGNWIVIVSCVAAGLLLLVLAIVVLVVVVRRKRNKRKVKILDVSGHKKHQEVDDATNGKKPPDARTGRGAADVTRKQKEKGVAADLNTRKHSISPTSHR